VPNFLTTAKAFLTGDYLRTRQATPEQKFNPADQAINWTYVSHLVNTANTSAFSTDGTGDGNSAVFACLMAISLASIEPPLTVFRESKKGTQRDPAPEQPLQDFLDDPNPWLDILEIRFWSEWARHLDGNAYLLKVRSGDARSGNPIELWPISPMVMTPWTDKGSPNFIDAYKWKKADGRYDYIPPENVIHFKLGIDDCDMRKGMSPLKRLTREILSDAEATKFADALLRNFGIPGLVVEVPKDAPPLAEDQILAMKAKMQATFGADNRGGVGVLTGGAVMRQFGFSPEQLNLKSLHDVPETRIAAVMGIPPAMAGLGVGLEQTSNFASMKQIRENFTEVKLLPQWKMDEAKWNKHLKPDFTSDKTLVIAHDLTDVRALQEDEDAKWTRVVTAWDKGVLTLDQALSLLGEAKAGGDEGGKRKGSTPEALAGATGPSNALPSATPTTPQPPNAPAAPGKALEAKSMLDDWPSLMQGLVELGVPAMAQDVDKLYDTRRRQTKRDILAGRL
jgi:HK97 family phage portal protein